MKESTRYALLLFSVLTFITASYIAINALGGPAETQPDMDDETNNTPEILEPNNTEENTSDRYNNTTENNENNQNDKEEPKGLLEKSVNGFKLLFSDIGEGINILSN